MRPEYCNRHGIITGATGTGKTVTLQILAEGFSRIGVPVFLADVKGDLSGLCEAIPPHRKIDERLEIIGIPEYQPRSFPTVFWDIFGESGHPIRTTVSEMGPLLLASMLELNDTQEGVLNVAFRAADEQGLLLLDFKDLRALLRYVSDNAKQLSRDYGNVSPASVAAIQRRLLVLEDQGAALFFGEPALNLADIMRQDMAGNGIINVLAADKLIHKPRLYSTFLLWLLAELFEELPEVGDPDKPRLVFFFDEAHLLFNRAPRALLDKVEQVVRLIRSKGVGIFFITQNPLDVPFEVLGQLGNRFQHALRAYTPRDQKAVRAAAQTFRANPSLDVEQAITQLGVGEALVSTLEEDGIPGIVERSPVAGKYDTAVDRESAFELLAIRDEEARKAQEKAEWEKVAAEKSSPRKRGRRRQSAGEKLANSAIRSIGYQLGRQIVRGILGSFSKGR